MTEPIIASQSKFATRVRAEGITDAEVAEADAQIAKVREHCIKENIPYEKSEAEIKELEGYIGRRLKHHEISGLAFGKVLLGLKGRPPQTLLEIFKGAEAEYEEEHQEDPTSGETNSETKGN